MRAAARIACFAFLLLAASGSPAMAEPAKPDILAVRDWPGPWGDAMTETAAKVFTERTGIPVLLDHRLDTAVSALIQAALAQHRPPPVDVFYTLAPTAHEDALRGVMDPLDPEEMPNLKAMLPIAKPPSPDGGWQYVNIGADILTLVYRKSKFPNGPPHSLSVMFDPAFKRRVLIYDSAEANIGLVALTNHWSIPADLDQVWQFASDRIKPMDPIIGGDPEAVGGFERNEIDLAFTYSAIPMSLGANGVDIGWTRADEGMMGLYEAAWIPRGLPPESRYWARRFIDLLLSEDVLSAYCTRLLIPCFRRDMPIPEAVANDPAFPKTEAELDALYTTPLDEFAAHQADWDARFQAIVK